MSGSRFGIVWALWLVGAAACEHKDAPAATATATTAAATAAAATARVEAEVDGGAALATKPATTGAPAAHVAADGGVAAAAASGAAPAGPLRIRPPMDRIEQGLRGTRLPGIMPRGGPDRGMLLNRPVPPSSSVQPPSAAQKR